MSSKSEFFERTSSEPLFRIRDVRRSEDASYRITLEFGGGNDAAAQSDFTLDHNDIELHRGKPCIRLLWIPPGQ